MKNRLLFCWLPVFFLLSLGMNHPAWSKNLFFPLIIATTTSPQPTAAIIVDHTSTDISKIPAPWLAQAKDMLKASYGHTSHGSQLIDGMLAIENSSFPKSESPF